MPDANAPDEFPVPADPSLEPDAGLADSMTFDTAAVLPVSVVDTIAPAVPPSLDLQPIHDAVAALEARVGSLPIADLARKVEALQTAFDREIRAEATREKVVDRLHAELQEYKNDLLMKVMKPIVIDLIQLHDDMGKRIEADPDSAVAQELATFRQGIEDALYRQGIEPYNAEGDTFDPRKQRAIKTESTDDPDRNKRVSSRIRPGFQSGDRIVRLELVSVYTHKP